MYEFLSHCLLQVLPHIKGAGYNAIQLIGVVEHKDYNTVGYRVCIDDNLLPEFGFPYAWTRIYQFNIKELVFLFCLSSSW